MESTYRFEHFDQAPLAREIAFRGGPKPGHPIPDFDLPATDGGRVTRADYLGERPVLIVFGSYT